MTAIKIEDAETQGRKAARKSGQARRLPFASLRLRVFASKKIGVRLQLSTGS